MPGFKLKLLIHSLLLLFAECHVMAATQQSLRQSPQQTRLDTEININETEISINIYRGKTEHLLLWFAPGYGFNERHHRLAAQLSQSGFETWLIDLSDALFLPRGTASIRQINGKYAAEIIRTAHQRTGKSITLVSNSYGAITALRAAHQWQSNNPEQLYLNGAILFSPNTFQTIPALGDTPVYLPVTRATSIPVMIMQGAKNSNRWQLDELINNLQQGGSLVYKKLMPDVTSLFHKEDKAEQTQAMLKQLPDQFRQIVPLLARTRKTAPQPLSAIELTQATTGQTGVDNSLRKYRGKVLAQKIDLYGVNKQHYVLNNYKGKITVVNFWATWCAPCIREIPSLNRLREKMHNHPFELVSINYAQDAAQIKDFMRKVKVDFPVLLDPDGRETARWNVIAFPSTFVIGPDGQIKYGVNAAIEWDTPEVLKQLQNLLE